MFKLIRHFLFYTFLFLNTFGIIYHAKSQTLYTIHYDPAFNSTFGSENLITFQKIIFTTQDSLIPVKLTNENDNALHKLKGMAWRTAKTTLLDFQTDYLMMLLQHEVFGHGSRFREFGYKNLSFSINLPLPFGNGSGRAKASPPPVYESHVGKSEQLAVLFSGNEANNVMATSIETKMISKQQIHYREALMYLLANNNQTAYIWYDYFKNKGTFGTGDIASYVFMINNMNLQKENHYTLKELSYQSMFSLLNPLQLYATFTLAKTYLFDGNTLFKKIPSFNFRDVLYLPVFGYNLTPFGSEYQSRNYFIKNKKTYIAKFSLGDNKFYNYYGAGLQINKVIDTKLFLFNLDINAWQQPPLELGGDILNNSKGGLGYSIKGDLSFFPFEKYNTAFFIQTAYKTDGYLMGEPLKKGIYGKFGISFKSF